MDGPGLESDARPQRSGTALKIGILSFRLGGSDGVAIEAAKWARALETSGHEVSRIAGEFGDATSGRDVHIPALALTPRADANPPADLDKLTDTLAALDLLIVENVFAIPMRLPASNLAAAAARSWGGPVIGHHHDPAWQRPHYAHIKDLPPELERITHVVINELTARQFTDRGMDATIVRNHFDFDRSLGDRAAGRAGASTLLGDDIDPETIVALHPVRAIERKNVPAALDAARELQARTGRDVIYWLAGGAEDGYGPQLERHLAVAGVPWIQGMPCSIADAYAASDVVVFPSTWEGFGNPNIESVWARKPIITGMYPVVDELRALGLVLADIQQVSQVAEWLQDREGWRKVAATNRDLARRHLDLNDLPRRLASLIDQAVAR